MNSRWQANKIGLINFWYYDEQEFSFVKGRMLLRGSNGSGKSVTMQSVVPLLLDGNMSPERLDPFGSRDRKMSSYLLEENDEREERIGYLYLEFKRQESETYLTVGMGIRARKGKSLDKWYFSLTDGRRIGKDFFLYKETDERVTLSKKELENRIQSGGQLFERQADYMEYVNRQIFGFETVEEYKEMIDLLIQLRTPKLSKDFKPSVINEILSDSLQPLSDEDLRPMSEAIENMDAMTLNLKSRQEGQQAAEKINRVLDRYNRLMLFEKAQNYEDNREKVNAIEQEEKKQEETIQRCEKRAAQLEQQETALDAKKDAMEKERESLSKSDAVALKKKEMELSERIEENQKQLSQKEQRLEEKKDLYVRLETTQKEEQNKQYQKSRELVDLLEEMQGQAEEMAFEEHAFFAEELKKDMEVPCSFDTHQGQLNKVQESISTGLEILRDADQQQRQVESQLQKREKQQTAMDAWTRKVNELEGVVIQTANEWKEALYGWNGKNREFKLSKDQLKVGSEFAENYDDHSDFSAVKNMVSEEWVQRSGALDAGIRKKKEESLDLQQQYEEQKKELEEWESHKEPEPFRSEAVLNNRLRLQKMGIPYQEFYKVIEFGQDLDKTVCDHLEEALLQMGILDALIVEETYRQQVLSLDEGTCDRYLFVQKNRAQRSILDVLDLNDSVNDIFFNQRITGVLENIAYESDGQTAVMSDGHYQIGVITGTITGEHEAGFLGTKAREKNRQAKIAACHVAMESLAAGIKAYEAEIAGLEEKNQILRMEYEAFPNDEDLQVAFRMLQDAEREYERMQSDMQQLEQLLQEMNSELERMKKEALEIAGKLYLTCSLDVFKRADEAARLYSQDFYQLKEGHGAYIQMVYRAKDIQERLEGLDQDMEQIRYEYGNVQRLLKKDEEEHASIKEQLKLTDYAEIQERLDTCLKWLQGYPDEVRRMQKEKTEQKEQIRNTREKKEQNAGRMIELKKRTVYLEKCYLSERALSYVELPDESAELPDGSAVIDYLSPECGELQREKVVGDLNQIYFENRAFLNDYQLTQTELFEELEEEAERGYPAARRMDIHARYQGIRIPFQKLLSHLEEDIAELRELIKDGDRELFEDILSNIVSRKIRGKINGSNAWVDKMNTLMGGMNTSSGLRLSLRWRSRTAENEDQLDTKELVDLLKKDYRLMREEEAAKLSRHFRSKVEEARRQAKDSGGMISFYQVMKETLDYRKWFEFQLFAQKSGEKIKELTNSVFGTFSGGEKAMSMYVPLFSAVVAKYQGGRADAPRLISLDEAFAGVDNKNIRDMFRLMTEFQFDFVINSQVLWGDCDTLDALAIYQLLRPENAKFVTVMPYLWNGRAKEMLEDEEEMEQRAAVLAGGM